MRASRLLVTIPAAMMFSAAVVPARAEIPIAHPLPGGPGEPFSRGVGPLSVRAKPVPMDWQTILAVSRANDGRKLDKAAMREDTDVFENVIDTFYRPRTEAQGEAVKSAFNDTAALRRLAPYSVGSTGSGLSSAGSGLHICLQWQEQPSHCDTSFEPKPPDPRPPYEISKAAPGVAMLTIRDLSNASDPAWARFETERAGLADAAGIVVDLSGAIGDDPRPLWPWLEQLTGRVPLRPLREINRPPDADRYVAAYRARFLPEGRNVSVWASLLPARSNPAPAAAPLPLPKQLVEVVVGKHCQAACELVARVLETYAGAFVMGGVRDGVRLARDEPALVILPRSQFGIFFHATEYLLSDAIEQVTGPSDKWTAIHNELLDRHDTADALAELKLRLKYPPMGWPVPCAALPSYSRHDEMPAAFHNKLGIPKGFTFSSGFVLKLQSSFPPSTLRRFLSTCKSPVSIDDGWGGTYNLGFPYNQVSYPVLSQIAQSEMISSVRVELERRLYLF